jgi:Protein of unknown function (DUF4232)
MARDRVNRVLDEFSAVTSAAPRPESPARRVVMRQRFPVATLTGASLIVVTVAVAALVFGRSGPSTAVGASPSVPAGTAVGASPSVPAGTAAASTPAASAPAASPSGDVAGAPCDPANLAARITLWEGAAGSRIAHVEVKNGGTVACILETVARPRLVGGDGTVLIDGKAPATSRGLSLPAGATASTLVQASNYCGAAPVAPVSIHFQLADKREIVAAPVSPTDVTVPPCLGSGQQATIAMQPWAR